MVGTHHVTRCGGEIASSTAFLEAKKRNNSHFLTQSLSVASRKCAGAIRSNNKRDILSVQFPGKRGKPGFNSIFGTT